MKRLVRRETTTAVPQDVASGRPSRRRVRERFLIVPSTALWDFCSGRRHGTVLDGFAKAGCAGVGSSVVCYLATEARRHGDTHGEMHFSLRVCASGLRASRGSVVEFRFRVCVGPTRSHYVQSENELAYGYGWSREAGDQ